MSERGIIDIFVFGSSVKGAVKPNDVDVIAVCSDDSKVSEVNRYFDGMPKEMDVKVVKLRDFLETHTLLRQAIVHEGYSVKMNRTTRELLGFEASTLFTFSLKNLQGSGKVRFQYAIYGRNGQKGVLGENKGRPIAPGAVLVPVARENEIEKFFQNWKIAYSKERWMANAK